MSDIKQTTTTTTSTTSTPVESGNSWHDWVEKSKQYAHQSMDALQKGFDQVVDKTKEGYEYTKLKASEGYDYSKVKFNEGSEKIKHSFEDMKSHTPGVHGGSHPSSTTTTSEHVASEPVELKTTVTEQVTTTTDVNPHKV
ncbi:hypothetical protein DLAC_10972 [Tieghemostelium lacteum]|uniref:Uncharacterized protein n=1 Tax=Tieghemostelium lacteum TaxID=361077 RepID=A0A151Z2V7_TIELA|nr:hypothetical protein DLAC_10972 [Tieghemostelium lacteum]|eukprot:KYQ88281.1 hypothetical protein DLAC_10972 [Tieghemostelium lacteum]